MILTIGECETVIDDEDFEAIHVCERYHKPGKIVARICDRSWKASHGKYGTYIASTLKMWCPIERDRVTVYLDMQRLIMNAPRGLVVDHRSGDTLDNRKQNLSLTTQSENCGKSDKKGFGASAFRGVSKKGNKWRAVIGVSNRLVHIGMYDTSVEAARAYDFMALQCFDNPSLNFPTEANA